MRNLNFSEFPAANLPHSPTAPGLSPQFSNCISSSGVLSSSCVDPTAAKLLALYPLPNENTSSEGVPGGLPSVNFVASPKVMQDSDEGAIRIDHKFSDSDNVYGHLVIFDLRQFRPGIFSEASLSQTEPLIQLLARTWIAERIFLWLGFICSSRTW